MKKDLEYYLALPYEILVRPLSKEEGGGYLARYKDFPYIMGDGESEAQAISDVKKAFAFCIETDLKEGVKIPEPIDENKKVRVNLTIPSGILNAIDAVTSNRSAWISQMARKALGV